MKNTLGTENSFILASTSATTHGGIEGKRQVQGNSTNSEAGNMGYHFVWHLR